ncbi:metallophosphoesterase [Ktedonosporobacter rubrisoli]|uniref:Metallophosphoesterase n=1 Tax=Ktedonosporobacter rubrisoli TaxID=2509675 RepID=A0A4P6JIT8_KTERU|nr:metallophosphoesterase family protein [Ktedonosporobacter rubrisoli]QBD74566.1 metallophosphoesterase [Ktedonosporobacter rubrisoli]
MKIAALYDIHSNLPALEAVLKELEEVQPDLILVGGDSVAGPFPVGTLQRLAQLGDRVRYIRGNGEREVAMAFDGKPLPSNLSEQGSAQERWAATQLTRAQRDFIAQLPEQLTLSVAGLGDILFCHATPRNDEEIFSPATSPERLATIFAGVKQQIVVCGHTHIQFELKLGQLRILNPGSVGMPYDDEPGACWLLLSPQGYEMRRTAYDLEAAAQAIVASGFPYAQEFVAHNVLQVPKTAETIEMLERMAEQS